jgi:hypothetical protein
MTSVRHGGNFFLFFLALCPLFASVDIDGLMIDAARLVTINCGNVRVGFEVACQHQSGVNI